MANDTIYAVATGEAVAALSVIRISGPDALRILGDLTERPPSPRMASLRRLRHQTDGEDIDEAIVLWFPRGASFTGEDVVELHIHGGPAVRSRLSSALEDFGARLAQPGEFARRRFDNGLFDATQAEGLADVIAAETAGQLRHARRLMNGDLGRRAKEWRGELLEALALIEAGLDFAEEDIGDETERRGAAALSRLADAFESELSFVDADEASLTTPTVAIIGPPNAGKSTLLNRLVEEELAIVTPVAGTTRDAIRSRVVFGGVALELIDTAGLRETEDEIEAIGVSRARSLATEADLRVVVLAPDVIEDAAPSLSLATPGDIVVWNKSDLGEPSRAFRDVAAGALRTETGDRSSLSELRRRLEKRLGSAVSAPSLIAGSARRKRLYKEGLAAMRTAADHLAQRRPEAAIECVRQALFSLEAIVGRVDQEEVYGEIFSRFCVGK